MDSFRIVKIINNVVYVKANYGYDVIVDVIPEAVNYINKNTHYNKIICTNLNHVVLEILPNTTIEENIKKWKKLYNDHNAETKQKNVGYSYKSADEAIADVIRINQKVDLKNGTTSIKDAVEFCKKAMLIFSKCDNLFFNDKQRCKFSEALKEKGACKYEEASNKYKDFSKGNVSLWLTQKDNIEFPLFVFSQVLDASRDIFDYRLFRIVAGGEKHSWPAEWLDAQTPKNKNIEL